MTDASGALDPELQRLFENARRRLLGRRRG